MAETVTFNLVSKVNRAPTTKILMSATRTQLNITDKKRVYEKILKTS